MSKVWSIFINSPFRYCRSGLFNINTKYNKLQQIVEEKTMNEDLNFIVSVICFGGLAFIITLGLIEVWLENKYRKLSKSKADFVTYELTWLLKSIEQGVHGAEYRKCKNGEEYVLIHYVSGCREAVCVTADSKAAMVKDVIRRVCR